MKIISKDGKVVAEFKENQTIKTALKKTKKNDLKSDKKKQVK